jgi:hypothetical protein
MKNFVLPAVVLGLGLLLPSAWAQGTSGSTNIADRVARIILPDPAALNSPIASVPGGRPARSERPEFPAELKLRLRSFESLREVYLARQEELRKKWRGAATDQDRERLRAQLLGLRDEWRDKALAFKEETRTRLDELKGELSSKYRDALDAAKRDALDAAAEHKRPRNDEH